MALRLNPATGKLEEEIEDVEDPALAARPAQPFAQGAGGGAPPVNLQIVQPPEQTNRSEWSRTETAPQETKTVVTRDPLVARAEDEAQNAAEDERSAQARKHAAEQVKLQAELNHQKQLETIQALELRDRQEKEAQHRAVIDAKRAAAAEAKQAHVAAQNTPEEKSVLGKVAMAFMAGLAQWSHVKAGGQGMSPAYQAMQDAEARDTELRMRRLKGSEAFAQAAATDVEAAKQMMADELANTGLKWDGMRAKALGQLDTIRARLKLPAADAAFEATQAQSDAKEAENEIKRNQKYDVEARTEGARSSSTRGGSDTTNIGGAAKAPPTPPDLSVTDEKGTPYQARNEKHVPELRDKLIALQGARQIAARLKVLNEERGRFPGGNDPAIDQEIKNLIEKKKAITGALTKDDELSAQAKLKAGMLRGAEGANAALGAFIGAMGEDFGNELNVKATRVSPPREVSGTAPEARPAPVRRDKATAGQLTEAQEWIRANPNAPKEQRDRVRARIREMSR